MTTLRDIFDYSEFQEAVYHGYIRVQTHPDFEELSIANYAEKAQFERFWTDEILASRGLIYNNQTLEVVARGFPKFFNWDDSGQPYPPTGPMILSTKFDGSLGIMYEKDFTLRIATRGSFASDQALYGTQILMKMLLDLDNDEVSLYDKGGYALTYPRLVNQGTATQLYNMIRDGKTPIFEIIYPGNRIVVDYHGEDRLVLLDVIDNKTGLSDITAFDNLYWIDKAEKILVKGGFSDSLTHTIPQGEEGFVLYWPGSGFRCKMKSAEYVELHRLVTGLSRKSVWEMISHGKTKDEIKENVPDELFAFVDETVAELNDLCAAKVDQVYDDFDTIVNIDPFLRDERNRKHFAAEAMKYPETRSYMFRILDGDQPEDIWKAVWRTLKPVGDTRAWGRTEDAEE